MKAVRVYSGNNSQGDLTEIALSESGKYFKRVWSFNGYGTGFSKWLEMDYIPKLKTKGFNQYSLEEYQIPESEQINWIECGFKYLELSKPPYSVRLPA